MKFRQLIFVSLLLTGGVLYFANAEHALAYTQLEFWNGVSTTTQFSVGERVRFYSYDAAGDNFMLYPNPSLGNTNDCVNVIGLHCNNYANPGGGGDANSVQYVYNIAYEIYLPAGTYTVLEGAPPTYDCGSLTVDQCKTESYVKSWSTFTVGTPAPSYTPSLLFPTSSETVPEFSAWGVHIPSLFVTTTEFSDSMTVTYHFATTTENNLDSHIDVFQNASVASQNDFRIPKGQPFHFAGTYYAKPTYWVTTYGANATTTAYDGSWISFVFSPTSTISSTATGTFNGVQNLLLSGLYGPFGTNASNLLGEQPMYSSSTTQCENGGPTFSLLNPFSSSSLGAVGCMFSSVGEWLVNAIVFPHKFSTNAFEQTWLSLKTTFPFVVFFQYTDAVRNAANLPEVPTVFAMTIPPFGTINILSSSTLDQAFGTTTTDALFPNTTMKQKIFNVQAAVMYIGTAVSALSIIML